jgi:hypothetical protein
MLTRQAVADATRSRVCSLRKENTEFAHLLEKIGRLGSCAIVGGAARDWAMGLPPRDIDIVVDADEKAIETATRPFVRGRTGLGGVRLEVEGLACDLWALSATWAFGRAADMTADLHILPRTAFLNIDAVAVDLKDWQVYEHRFLEAWDSRVLDVNFAPNPRPALCIARALGLALKYDLRISPTLAQYVISQLHHVVDWSSVLDAYKARYAHHLDPHALHRVVRPLDAPCMRGLHDLLVQVGAFRT